MTTAKTLNDLIQSPDPTIRRHALGIKKILYPLIKPCNLCGGDKIECDEGHRYCPECEIDGCDIPL